MSNHTKKNGEAGFTLLEIIVVISIITITTSVLFSAFPIARTNQFLQSDVTEIRLYVSGAQQAAINEIRAQECLTLVGADEDLQRRCSDIGVHIAGQEMIQFADISNNLEYNPDNDFIIQQQQLRSQLREGEDITVLFDANPPTVVTYVNGQVLGAGQTHPFTLELDTSVRSLTVAPYGVIAYDEE